MYKIGTKIGFLSALILASIAAMVVSVIGGYMQDCILALGYPRDFVVIQYLIIVSCITGGVVAFMIIYGIIGRPMSDKNGAVACGFSLSASYELSSASVAYDSRNHKKIVHLCLTLSLDELHLVRGGLMNGCVQQVFEAVFPFSQHELTRLYVSSAGARRIKRKGRRDLYDYVQLEFELKQPYYGRNAYREMYGIISDWDLQRITSLMDGCGAKERRLFWSNSNNSGSVLFTSQKIKEYRRELKEDAFIKAE